MKKVFTKILFVVGLLIFLFPFAMRLFSYLNQTTAIYDYKQAIKSKTEEEIQQQQQISSDYNNRIADESPIINMGGEEFEEAQNNSSVFDFSVTSEVIGTIIIPKINVNLPIYDGLLNDNLQKGVAHLNDTSYPTGELNTHCVLAGHSGLTKAKILDDLDQIQLGDTFQIEYLNNTFNYEVIDIKVVLPDDTECLKIREGETIVTLVTCTPKSINTHRLLVVGKKVDVQEEPELTLKDKVVETLDKYYIYIIISDLVIILLIIYVVCNLARKKKLRKEFLEKQNKEDANLK